MSDISRRETPHDSALQPTRDAAECDVEASKGNTIIRAVRFITVAVFLFNASCSVNEATRAPGVLKRSIEVFVMNVSAEKPKAGLQSVTLHVPMLRVEPHREVSTLNAGELIRWAASNRR